MLLKTSENIKLENKTILLRIDVNSALIKNKPLDSPRFIAHSKTISQLLKKKAKLVILAHQGRKGKKDYLRSLEEHAKILSRHSKYPIKYVHDLFGKKAKEKICNLKPEEAIILENVRNYNEDNLPESQENYKKLCSLCDIYINDAFSVCHRKQASIILPPKFLQSYAGYNLSKELKALDKFNSNKKAKTAYLLGGEKFEDYLPLFKVLKNPETKILASGVLANAFLAAEGYNLGYENIWLKEKGYSHLLPKLKKIFNKYRRQIILPLDFATGNIDPKKVKNRKEINFSHIPVNEKIWDVGHNTITLFKEYLLEAEAAFMKGPLGFSEMPAFSHSTIEILKFISKLTKENKVFSLLGGGHLTTAITKYKIPNYFSYTSLSGGATILYLSGEKLPGLEALKKSRF